VMGKLDLCRSVLMSKLSWFKVLKKSAMGAGFFIFQQV